jgi:hypothetical protein
LPFDKPYSPHGTWQIIWVLPMFVSFKGFSADWTMLSKNFTVWCGDPDNVGNEIIYTAEPYEDVEMSECNANVNVSSLDNTSTKTSTWPLLCVERFMYDPSWIVLYGILVIPCIKK